MTTHVRDRKVISKRQWLDGIAPVRRLPLDVTGPGIAEIKPHSKSGEAAGLRQLARRAEDPRFRDSQKWLVTYLPVRMDGSVAQSGRATRVRVFAGEVRGGKVMSRFDLGATDVPPSVPFPRIDETAFFGMAIEDVVRKRFATWLPAPRRDKLRKKTGGSRIGPDMIWNEIANFYSALARELGDELYEELSSELAALAS
ncbi:hypothetical protein [Prescottella agglutinans]|uniref:hypothetical protein n=1 Tax=Prescottella agglutinans TaxID=1644129 RepID=UPI003D9791DF